MSQVFSFLKTDGIIMLVGLPMEPLAISSFSLIDKRKGIIGSAIGSIKETQEMIDYCFKKNTYCFRKYFFYGNIFYIWNSIFNFFLQ